MNSVAAYLMIKMSGGDASADAVTKVVAAAGGEVDAEKLALFMTEVEGLDLNEVMTAGLEKLGKVSVGGGGGGGGGGAAAAVVEVAAKEEVVEEEMDMGGNADMFGGEAGTGDY
jgi:large subunit ribosomal protein LP2